MSVLSRRGERQIRTLLVADRGEIARRVFAGCRALGVGTVAVCSDADAGAPYAREADAAVRLPGRAPAETYLRGDLVVRAALDAGADAVHPGYGFLAESAEFARAVLDAGLTWVGPPPEAIAAMGSKTAAKRIMAAAGVPVLGALDPARVTAAQLPLLVKAVAGGGGRGMRIVRRMDELGEALASARAQAAACFGSDEVFCEPYAEAARHVEAQVLADAHGTVWVVGERDCSIQRRHQKIVEEAPAPGFGAAARAALHEAARAAARAVGYAGAGTVEFLYAPAGAVGDRAAPEGADGADRLYFLEVNTRLQVEHPVTECVTGLDLVALQLRVAEGGALPGPDAPAPRGHAIEVRLYAEDPARGWLPQTGTLHRFAVPGVTNRFGAGDGGGGGGDRSVGLRLDAGVEDGSVIGAEYDSMLAKLVAWAPTRAAAARKLADALARAEIHGPQTNRELLVRVLRHPAFLAGDVHTGFLAEHEDALPAYRGAAPLLRLAALAAALADAATSRATAPVLRELPSGWRNVPAQAQVKRYRPAAAAGSPADADASGDIEVRYRFGRAGLVVESVTGDALGDGHRADLTRLRLLSSSPTRVVLEVGGVRRAFCVAVYGRAVHVDSPLGAARLTALDRFPAVAAGAEGGSLRAPMPGAVARIAAAEGEHVTAGEPLLWIEAMKMEHAVEAPADGLVAELRVRPGQHVELGTVLAVLAPPKADKPEQAEQAGQPGKTALGVKDSVHAQATSRSGRPGEGVRP